MSLGVVRVRAKPWVRSRLGDGEAGFTLVELLVSIAMALVVLTATLTLLVQAQTDSAGAVTRGQSVQDAQVALRQMVQELDQAYEVEFPTSTADTGCTESSTGVQPCNVADVLERVGSSPFSGTDFEVRYDCTVASTTISGDRACWRYLCSAAASTGSGSSCTASSGTLLSKRLVLDHVVNGTSSDPVFSFCYPNPATTGAACASGAARPVSATVAVKVPAGGSLSSLAGGDQSTVILTSGVYMSNLDLNQ